MAASKKRSFNYEIAACLDTETTSIFDDSFVKEINNQEIIGSFAYIYTIATKPKGKPLSELEIPKEYDCTSFEEGERYGEHSMTVGDLTCKSFRFENEFVAELLNIVCSYYTSDLVPVMCVHNMGYDIHYFLKPFIEELSLIFDTPGGDVLALSKQSPLTITITEANNEKPLCVLWDTKRYSGGSLSAWAKRSGYYKPDNYDYEKPRTPYTPLSSDEMFYIYNDVSVMFACLKNELRLRDFLSEEKFARSVITKTGVVREDIRTNDFENLQSAYKLATEESVPTDSVDFKLYFDNNGKLHLKDAKCTNEKLVEQYRLTQRAANRGGLVACSNRYNWKSIPGCTSIDAASMHPSHMISHYYPTKFSEILNTDLATEIALNQMNYDVDYILKHWTKPFRNAFLAKCEFTKLRPKKNSIFSEDGILTFMLSKVVSRKQEIIDSDTKDAYELTRKKLEESGYRDQVSGAETILSKIASCEHGTFFLTELEMWIVNQVYDFSSFKVLSGFWTNRFTKPTQRTINAVTTYYERKNEFKQLMKELEHNGKLKECPEWVASDLREKMLSGCSHKDIDVENTYMNLKADLNALYGIDVMNEWRVNYYLDDLATIQNEDSIDVNELKLSKVWYNFGMRVVGWSRLQEIIAMLLIGNDGLIIYCDTDSIKYKPITDHDIFSILEPIHNAIYESILAITDNQNFKGIGWYEVEHSDFELFAITNKSYACNYGESVELVTAGMPYTHDKAENDITVFGKHVAKDEYIPFNRLELWFMEMLEAGYDFNDLCRTVFHFNTLFDDTVISFNQRYAPTDNERHTLICNDGEFTCHLGIALDSQGKMLLDTNVTDTLRECTYITLNKHNEAKRAQKLTFEEGELYIQPIDLFDEYARILDKHGNT